MFGCLRVVEVAVGAAPVLVLHVLVLVVPVGCDDVGLPPRVALGPPSCGGCLVITHWYRGSGDILQYLDTSDIMIG